MAMINNHSATFSFKSRFHAWYRAVRTWLRSRLGLGSGRLPGHQLGVAMLAAVAPLFGVGGLAVALNAPEQEVIVRTLTAEQIRELTEDKTWIIDFDNSAIVSTTYYKVGGERFTERDGLVERLQWFIDEQADRRCVRSAFGSRCGYIVSFGSTLKICMQLNPLGDCSYTVARIISGDQYGLEQRARF